MRRAADALGDWDQRHRDIPGFGVHKKAHSHTRPQSAAMERFRALLDSSGDMILLVELPSGRLADVNESVCRNLHRTRRQLLSLSLADIVDPSSSAWAAALRGDTASLRRMGAVEASFCLDDGSPLCVEMTISTAEFDHVHYAVVLARDITERKRMQDAAQHERAFLRKVIDTVPSFIFVKDWDGRFVLGNQAVADCHGTSVEGMMGKTDADLNPHPEEVEHFRQDDREVMTTRQPKLIPEEKVTYANGEEHWLSTIKVPLISDDGQCRQVLGVATDMTQRRRAEEALQQAKTQADAANQAKDHFLAVLSHELRTPLTPVLTAVQMLERDPDIAGDLRQTLSMIRRNVELETRLIDDLLDLTRISRGKLQLHFQPTDLHEKIRHVAEICDSDLRAKQLRWTLDLQAADHQIQADPARLQQMLWNLVKNAIKFTPFGGAISLHTENVGGMVQIRLRDTGIGIAPDVLPRIFDPFQQGGREVTRLFGGLGLGLSITRALVERHGGTISARSEGRNRGTEFTLRLPISAPAGQQPAHAQPRLSGHVHCRILLVEDHADTARIMTDLLSGFGCQVRSVDSVAAALRAAQAHPFELLICDIGLPDGSGYDVMRQLSSRYAIKGIALSGYGMEEDIRKSREAGFEAHLTKPINLLQLEAMIANLAAHPPTVC